MNETTLIKNETMLIMNDVIVSVAIITYNQEDNIENALLSVLEQDTNFNYEIIVGDDCSTDKTSEICRKYEQKYPGKVKHIKNEKNLGYINNLLNVFSKCTGEFIAILEGDDLWVSPGKLEDQVRVFRQNKNLSLCFTNCEVDDPVTPHIKQFFFREGDMVFNLTDCLKQLVTPVSSFMFRRNLFIPPKWFSQLVGYEHNLIYLLAEKGDIYYLNKLTSCRRQTNKGLSTTSERGDRMAISQVKNLNNLLGEYSKETRKKVRNIIVHTQIHIISNLISDKKLTVSKDLIPHIHISKVKWNGEGLKLVGSYLKLVTKYYLVKFNLLKVKVR